MDSSTSSIAKRTFDRAAGLTLRAAVLSGQIRHPEFRPAVNKTPVHTRND